MDDKDFEDMLESHFSRKYFRFYTIGNTYNFRYKLSEWGWSFDNEKKSWWVDAVDENVIEIKAIKDLGIGIRRGETV